LVCSPARAGKRDPAHPRKSRREAISGSPRSGDLRLDERKKRSFFKVRGKAAVEIVKAGSEDEGGDPSLVFVNRARSGSMSAPSSLPRCSSRTAGKSTTSISGLCTGG
jgi:hypothetical protein